MKMRIGFVSNSSSSSFILDGNKFTKDKIEEYITTMAAVDKLVHDTDYETINDFCTIYEDKSPKIFNERLKDHYGDRAGNIKHKGKVIIVDSTSDNSIPRPIQEALESISLMRAHWG